MIQSAKSLDALLVGVINGNRDRVVGWMNEEPGSWGFLAGRAVLACKEFKGAPLTESERREVWGRMWELLTVIKEHNVK